MLPRTARLASGRAIVRTRRTGRRAGTSTLVLHLTTAGTGTEAGDVRSSRAAVVAGRAVGPAVVRNRVKRRLRHLLADRWDALPMGTELVVRALPPAAAADARRLGHDLDRALARALDGHGPSEGVR